MYLITGITGHVGGAAARHLLDEGHAVRALVRDSEKAAEWADQGVELVEGDLTDAATVAAALGGVEGAFLMQPTPIAVAPDFPEAHALIDSFLGALRQSPPPRLVVLSSVGSEQTSGLGNITQTHLLERALDEIPVPTVFVRAGAFLENHVHALGRAADTGVFDSFLQPTGRAFPMVASEDIGREVARRLVGEAWDGKRVVEIGSPVSPDDLARALGDVLGRPVEARPVPRERWTTVMEAMGIPPEKVGPWEAMQDGFNSGWIDFGVAGAESVAGTTSPADVFQHAQSA